MNTKKKLTPQVTTYASTFAVSLSSVDFILMLFENQCQCCVLIDFKTLKSSRPKCKIISPLSRTSFVICHRYVSQRVMIKTKLCSEIPEAFAALILNGKCGFLSWDPCSLKHRHFHHGDNLSNVAFHCE